MNTTRLYQRFATYGLLFVLMLLVSRAHVTATPPSPTVTATGTATATPSATPHPLDLARTPAAANTAWTPFEADFAGTIMVLVPAGCFEMGSTAGDSNEQPVHEQCFDTPFWIDKTEVTQAQFQANNGLKAYANAFSGDQRPVETLSWSEAAAYCAARGGRLPTEAEWEYAARGPESRIYPWGNDYTENIHGKDRRRETADVGTAPDDTSWVGTQDMGGNVTEWTSSLFSSYPFIAPSAEATDAATDRRLRVIRGGSMLSTAYTTRAAYRGSQYPYNLYANIGFRCVQAE